MMVWVYFSTKLCSADSITTLLLVWVYFSTKLSSADSITTLLTVSSMF